MGGVLGLDIQATRTALAITEVANGVSRTSSVGDGHRALVPNATAPGGLWGTAAAEYHLAADVSEIGSSAGRLSQWQRAAPWTPAFFSGVTARLTEFLGRTAPTHANRYSTVVSAGPDGPDPQNLHTLCIAGGLDQPSILTPTDAMLARWITHPLTPQLTGAEAVLVVACGEEWTSVAGYEVRPQPGRLPAVRRWAEPVTVAYGSGRLNRRIAAAVVDRCIETAPSSQLIGVSDGVLELAAMVRELPADQEVEYLGALADILHSPVRVSRRGMRDWPEVTVLAGEVVVAARRVAEMGRAKSPLVVIGGPGAVWPFVPEAMHQVGRAWARSNEPELDLATGATRWPDLPYGRSEFGYGAVPVNGPVDHPATHFLGMAVASTAPSDPADAATVTEWVYEGTISGVGEGAELSPEDRRRQAYELELALRSVEESTEDDAGAAMDDGRQGTGDE